MKTRVRLLLPPLLALLGCGSSDPQQGADMTASIADAATSPDATFLPDLSGQTYVLLGQGHVGRTFLSCDDGLTWIRDMSDNDAGRCFTPDSPNNIECDHTALSGHGIDAGDGYIYTNFGWGENGTVRRSVDGTSWTTVKDGGWGSGIGYSSGSLFLFWSFAYQMNGYISKDQGATWAPRGPSDVLDHHFQDHVGMKRIEDSIAIWDSGDGVAVSHDGAATWVYSTSFMPAWAENGHFTSGKGTLVLIGYHTDAMTSATSIFASRSIDGGATWTEYGFPVVPNGIEMSDVVFDGKVFSFWTNGNRYSSSDGSSWAIQSYSGTTVRGPVAATPAGTLVYVTAGWTEWYEKQHAFRSTDGGLTWTQLDDAHFTGSHPVQALTGAYMSAAVCNL